MTDIRSATDGGAGLLTRLSRAGRLPVGKDVQNGHVIWVRFQTAAALVRRGHARFILGSDGGRWIEITEEGRALRSAP